ncbi:MAG: GAF domain-containing protein [Chloroflexi bacterium]|nr:GAF domain-containing protein [Chloroflexota bacterium]
MNRWKPLSQRWRGLGITGKFTLAFSALLILVVLGALTGFLALTIVRSQTEVAIVSSMEIQRLVLEMNAHLQHARKLEKDFFLRWPTIGFSNAHQVYVEEYREQIVEVIATSTKLRAMISDPDVSNTLREGSADLQTHYVPMVKLYADNFDRAIELVSSLTADESGVLPRLEHSAMLLHDILQIADDPALMALYHEMRSFEKDYLLTGERSKMQSAFNVANALSRTVGLSPAWRDDMVQQAEVLACLEDHQVIARELLDVNNQIRTLRNGFDLQSTAVDSITDNMPRLADEEVVRARNQIARTSQLATALLIVAVAAAMILVVAIAVALNNSITRNVVKLTETAGELQAGNLEVQVQIDSTDELGQLANSFNAMAARINTLVGELEGQAATAETRLFQAIESISEGFSLYDADDRFVLGNNKYREMHSEVAHLIVPGTHFEEIVRSEAKRNLYPDAIDHENDWIRERVEQHNDPRGAFEQQLGDGRWLQISEYKTQSDEIVGIYTDVTERKQAEEALRRQNEYLEALHETTLGLISRLDINDLLETLIVRAGQLLGTPHGYIYLVEPTTSKEIERRVGTGIFSSLVGSRLKVGEGLAGKIWQAGQPLVISDYDTWSGRSPDFEHGIIRAIMGVPLTQTLGPGESGSQPAGVIGMAYSTESGRVFGNQEVKLLERFAELASVALDNAQLFQVAQRRAQEAETLRYAGAMVAATLKQEEAIKYILQELRRVVPHDSASVQLLHRSEKSADYLEIVGGHGWPNAEAVAGLRIPIPSDNPNTIVVQERQTLILTDAPAEYASFRDGRHSRIQSWLGVPLIVHDQVIGMLAIDSMQPGYFTRDHARLTAAFADQVAIAIENARLFGETERRVAELDTLTDVGKALSSTLRIDEVLQLIYEQTRRVMYAKSMFIMLYNQTNHEIECAFSNNPQDIAPGTCFPVGTGLTGYIIKHRKSVLLRDDVSEGIRKLGLELAGQQSASWLGVPMIAGERLLGVIIIQHYTTPNIYDESHRVLLETIASQAAIAMQNAYLFEDIQREKQYSDALVVNSPTAIVVGDAELEILSWNPAAEKLFGYTEDEAIGRQLDDLIATKAMRTEADTFTRQATKGQIVRAITKRSRKDGRILDVELLGVPLIVEGERIGNLVIYHDITELERARQEAEAANQAKSTFLATMSHEIRTPMNGVIGMTSLLLDTNLTPEQREFTETIRQSGDSLLTIINDILDFSKIDAGRMDLEKQPFDVRKCVESALDLLMARAADKGLELACLVDKQVPVAIVGDVTRLRQILTNLLGNAVKFTEQGEVVVHVTGVEKPNCWEIHFSVQDTGIGIPPERMDRLFQSFSQVDASTSRRYGGTGLGLVISRRLSELMGGAMWVESPPSGGAEKGGGPGSTFHFTIQANTASIPTPAYLQESHPDLQGRQVLIVDDNATNRRVLDLQTRSWGMLPRDTALPAEALEWVRQGVPFDVVILDAQMPDVDGMMLAGKIRQERDARSLPIVLLSSLGRREAGEAQTEFLPYLVKPIKAAQLYNVLGEILAGKERKIQHVNVAARSQFDPEMATRLPLRILLVEDNAVNQKLALRLLERMGYRADVAGNGLEALEALRRQTYDVALMDVQMPEMDGLEATRTICREWPRQQRPRIIAMTANAMAQDRETCLEAGMDDYISKPIQVEELVNALNKSRPLEKYAGHDL